MEKRILVVGSFVKDLIVQTDKIPNEGETVLGNKFSQADGGKGANQAVQAARLNSDTTLIGKVGDDCFGKQLVLTCAKSNVNVENVIQDKGNSGVSSIILQKDKNGNYQNRILLTPGANFRLTVDDVKFLEDQITNYNFIILQFEIPMEVNEYLAKIAHEKGVKVIVNPAPSKKISDEFIKNIDFLMPNEHEFFDQTGFSVTTKDGALDKEAILRGSKILFNKGLSNLIITLGSNGSCFINKEENYFIESVKNVKSVDPTAAGDSFIGAFVSSLSKGYSVKDSIYIANAVGSLTVQRMGAMPSLCTYDELKEYLITLKDPEYKHIAKLFNDCKEQSIDALEVFKNSMTFEFDRTLSSINRDLYKDALDIILKAKENNNRVHVTGIGKPSHIAQYFASLISSTGTPAYYLHGTEAAHGSSGQLVPGDVVIAISNSGNTSELINTLYAVKNNGCKIIGVSGNASSKLAKMSDAHLLAHIDNEGGPLNRAPRTSIIAELLVLMGLSVLLQEDAKVSPKQYVKWHPGGALGQLREGEKK